MVFSVWGKIAFGLGLVLLAVLTASKIPSFPTYSAAAWLLVGIVCMALPFALFGGNGQRRR